MQVNDIINLGERVGDLFLLQERCSQFIEESQNLPLMMNLPKYYGDFHKVKVRKRKHHRSDEVEFAETFNEAFEHSAYNLRQRSVFAYGSESFDADFDKMDPFYVFPTDGYQFIYSSEIENSSSDYKAVFDTIFEEFGATKGNEVLTELLKFSYTSEDLHKGIEQGSEIILFNIPYFYAIRTSSIDNYHSLMTSINKIT